MKIIFAFGNPGVNYSNTRHNVGFMAVNLTARQHNARFAIKHKFFSEIAELSVDNEKVLLVKPTTYYNEVGRPARVLMDFYNVAPDNFLIIHDDLALPFGTLRIRQGGQHGGNNGLKSLSAHLPAAFWRLRIGILSAQRNQMPDADFVLGRFTPDEQTTLQTCIMPAARDYIDHFIKGTIHADTTTTC